MEAVALQSAMLNGVDIEICKALITQNTVNTIVENLNKSGRDRLSNDEGECFIFVMFGE